MNVSNLGEKLNALTQVLNMIHSVILNLDPECLKSHIACRSGDYVTQIMMNTLLPCQISWQRCVWVTVHCQARTSHFGRLSQRVKYASLASNCCTDVLLTTTFTDIVGKFMYGSLWSRSGHPFQTKHSWHYDMVENPHCLHHINEDGLIHQPSEGIFVTCR